MLRSTLQAFSARTLKPITRIPRFLYSTNSQPPPDLDQGEKQIYDKLAERFSPSHLQVQDVSGTYSFREYAIASENKVPVIGGCGSFYAITIASKSFTDLSTVRQHRLVNDALKEEIKGIHGLQVRIISFYASYTGAEDLRQLKTIPDSEQK